MSNYAAITATTQIKVAAGKLNGIFVSSASSTPTITVYDSFKSSNSDPVVLATFIPTANTMHNFFQGLYVNKGIYVVIGGTVSATISYE
jgi:hypothetical protein